MGGRIAPRPKNIDSVGLESLRSWTTIARGALMTGGTTEGV